MKKNMILFGLMIVSTVIFAQRKADPRERADRQAEHLKTELGLDEVQYKAVKAINEEHAGKLMKMRRDSTLSKETKQQQVRTLHNEKEMALKKVLTEDQHKKLVTNRANHGQRHGSRMAKHQGDYSERMQKELSLTEEQTAKLKTINREFGQKLRALRSDTTISKEDNSVRSKQLRDEHQTKLKSILTEEQIKKWEKLRSEHKRRKA